MGHRRTALVTGGAGYVGSHAVHELLNRDYNVVVFDNLQQGHRESVRPGAELVEGDLGDAKSVTALFERHRFDAVLHFAANSLVGESMQKPFKYLGDNVINATRLIEAALAHGVQRFVLSSTANLFGTPRSVPIGDDAEINPGSPYGESKYAIERMLHWADRTQGLRSACLRYFNAAGALPGGTIGEDHSPETHLIPIVLQTALGRRDAVEIFGADYNTPDGTCIRDYVHVVDLANAHVLALEALEDRSCRYNLGNGQGYSVREVIEAARAVTGSIIPARTAPRRPGDPPVLVASSIRAIQELGWKPRFASLEAIIETAWEWHGNHPEGFGSATA